MRVNPLYKSREV